MTEAVGSGGKFILRDENGCCIYCGHSIGFGHSLYCPCVSNRTETLSYDVKTGKIIRVRYDKEKIKE